MHEHDDASPNTQVILLGIGGAALAALLIALARRDKDEGPAAAVRETAARVGIDSSAAERDLKAAAWDAQQQAREAESRLRAARHRVGDVVDDASHIASRFGEEARNLAGEGRERIAHLRHREDAESALERQLEQLRAEVDELRGQLGLPGRRRGRGFAPPALRFGRRGTPTREAIVSDAAAAAIAPLERAFRDKAPELLAAKNRGQVLEILQRDLGPTLREALAQAATAGLTRWDATRDEAMSAADKARERTRDFSEEAAERSRRVAEDIRAATRDAADEARERTDEAMHRAESVMPNGKRRLWRSRDPGDAARETIEQTRDAMADALPADDEEHRGRAGLLWGGAGLGLALYALMDAERRERVIQFANEASIQVQELMRDLQGYDDEF